MIERLAVNGLRESKVRGTADIVAWTNATFPD